MDKEDRAEAIATALIWLIGLALFAWSWQVSGSFIAALIVTAVGGFFLVLLAGPLVAVAAFLLSLAADLIWPPRSRP
ncbi:hypothetical protein [Gulbenkiania mobilis]|uniref:Uncharacterized protein n=1 Tax=Gulbenkiania mobilis TaxID=397457 RepID=A0ABY2CVZ9_GULMO|nr:hypothetical protein EV669_105110 [Gulbenkiania mobilis]